MRNPFRKFLAGILIILAVFAIQPPIRAYGGDIVVITPTGKKYHRMGCRTVRKSYKQLTVSQAQKRGYKPCKVCVPPR
ncbi:MAG: hypothetical protein IJT58_09595 [Synergistaceae bacterium]|nr:hypothetical protein [Synergistaceae bacterium]